MGKFNFSVAANISAGSGGAAAPLEIFWPPLADFCPPSDFYPGPFLGQKTPLIRRRFFALFYLRTLVFESKRHSKSGEDLFLENAGFSKRHSNFSEEPYFALQALGLLVLPPPPVLK